MVPAILFIVALFIIHLIKDYNKSKTNNKIDELNINDTTTLEKLCEKYASKKQYDSAGRVCSQYLKSNPNSYDWVNLGALYYYMHSSYNSDQVPFANFILPYIKSIDEIVDNPLLLEQTKKDNNQFNRTEIVGIYTKYSAFLKINRKKEEAEIYAKRAKDFI